MATHRVITDLGEVYFSNQESKDGTITHIITCSISDIYPKQKLKKKSIIYLYDETLSLKAKGEVIAIDRKTNQVKVITTNNQLTNLSSYESENNSKNSPWNGSSSAFGSVSIILNITFLWILYKQWEVIASIFVIGNSPLAEIFNSVENISANASNAEGLFAITGMIWAFLLLPVMAALFTNLHWQARGDIVSGWLSTLMTSASGGIFAWFIATWLLINGYIPVNIGLELSNSTSWDDLFHTILAIIVTIWIIGFLIFMTACLLGRKSKEKIESI